MIRRTFLLLLFGCVIHHQAVRNLARLWIWRQSTNLDGKNIYSILDFH